MDDRQADALTSTEVIEVVTGGPIAVLLVDLDERRVVHANSVAEQLAPQARLPIAVEEWSESARLRDLDGADLTETDHPLSRVARSEPVEGQAVSAERRSDLGARREPLWVVALPLTEAPGLEHHALVVLMPLSERATAEALRRAPEGSDALLHRRAVLATGLSFTVADARLPDMPLVWVNPAFTATTGYELSEAAGRNCRFLQGPGTDPEAPRRMREAFAAGETVSVTLLNYRKDGLAFWNQVTMSPIRDAAGTITHYVGVQTDVSSRVAADAARDQALVEAQLARVDAEAAQERLQLMVESSARLSHGLEPESGYRILLDLVVPRLADLAVLVHLDADGHATTSVRHRSPEREPELGETAQRLATPEQPRDRLWQALQGGEPQLIADVAQLEPVALLDSHQAVLDAASRFEIGSAVAAGLPGRTSLREVLLLGRSRGRTALSPADLDVVADLGMRAGLILDNARLYQSQQMIAETLQRSLLPSIPQVGDVTVAARYLPATSGAEVGGDFYDVQVLDDERIGLAVGDVLGHDVYAAAAMGHLTSALRTLAIDTRRAPAQLLERVDALLDGVGMPTLASVLYAQLQRVDHGWSLTWSSAGHPPLLLREPDGSCRYLQVDDGHNDVLLGVAHAPRREQELRLPAGSTLVSYTDGLVERRGGTLFEGMERLRAALTRAPEEPEAMCEHLVESLVAHDDLSDDVALLVVRLGEPAS